MRLSTSHPANRPTTTVISQRTLFLAFSLANTNTDIPAETAASPSMFPLRTEMLTTSVDLLRKSTLPKSSSGTDCDVLLRPFAEKKCWNKARPPAQVQEETQEEESNGT